MHGVEAHRQHAGAGLLLPPRDAGIALRFGQVSAFGRRAATVIAIDEVRIALPRQDRTLPRVVTVIPAEIGELRRSHAAGPVRNEDAAALQTRAGWIGVRIGIAGVDLLAAHRVARRRVARASRSRLIVAAELAAFPRHAACGGINRRRTGRHDAVEMREAACLRRAQLGRILLVTKMILAHQCTRVTDRA
jgi:hypothetical protein